MCWMRIQLLVAQKTPSCAPWLGLTFRIQINAHQSRSCRCGRPHQSLWSVCTHRSKLPTVVAASKRCATVWAIARKSCIFVCRLFPCVTASECVTPRLNLLLDFRSTQVVRWVAVILVLVHFEAAAPLLVKVPFGSFPHQFKKKKPIMWFKKHMTRIVIMTVYVQGIWCKTLGMAFKAAFHHPPERVCSLLKTFFSTITRPPTEYFATYHYIQKDEATYNCLELNIIYFKLNQHILVNQILDIFLFFFSDVAQELTLGLMLK